MSRNTHQHQPKRYFNLTTYQNDSKQFSTPIPSWRKQFIPGKETIVKDNKTFHWCPHHKNEKYGHANGSHVSSHTPAEHDEWAKDEKNSSRAERKVHHQHHRSFYLQNTEIHRL